MTHEMKHKDRFIDELHMKYACGWTSEELACKAISERRMWADESSPAKAFNEWIGKHLKNEFTVQTMQEEKLEEYLKTVNRPLALTCNINGLLYDGDTIRLKWAYSPKSIFLSALPRDVSKEGRFLFPIRATGSEDSRIMARNAFRVCRSDKRIPSSVPLMYDECIYICTELSTGQLMLHSEMKTYEKFSLLSGNQEVCWKSQLSARSLWKILCGNEQSMKRSKHKYIMVNTAVILTHVATNQNLALEEDIKISAIMGDEYEISAQTYSSKRKSEPSYLWIFETPYDIYDLRMDSESRREEKV